MNARQMTFPLPGNGPAVLTLPQPLAPEALLELEHSLTAALRNLQRETRAEALEPGQIEYASWLQRLAAMAH
ncbi:hypothetical protein [Hydrogenophaga sp. PAMC20947]|uniref:hypothetical protein n=1 Tax=Hydrogenophaga sp. PAMC20947 TaxID=2565558 RepID=UPI00109DCF13|nr:hypothetical protein [Hydrogenophaga sp. PAMC20947]QCB45376.1 hypothetical protein E5678_04630 [Hydrogenophaga sp. PAMC20947]